MLSFILISKLKVFFEISIITLTIFGEGQGETKYGRQLIGNVIQNRAEETQLSNSSVCLKKKQFSYWNNFDGLQRDIKRLNNEIEIGNTTSLNILVDSYDIAKDVYNGRLNHLSKDVLFYTHIDIDNSWTRVAEIILIYKNHKFMILRS